MYVLYVSFLIQLPTRSEPTTLPESAASGRGSHQMLAASGCERRYALRYISRLRPVDEPPWRLVGTLIHHCLAHHYASRLDPRPEWCRLEALAEDLHAQSNNQPEQVTTALEVYDFYRGRMSAESLAPVAVEEEYGATVAEIVGAAFEVPEVLASEWITCRTDLVGLINGRVYIIDFKCTGGGWRQDRLDPWQADGEYSMSFQAMVNLLILSKRLPEQGLPAPTGFVIRRIKRRAPYDLDHHVLDLSPLALEDAKLAIVRHVQREQEIRATVARGEKPAPNYGMCFGRYGPCDYHSVCSAKSRMLREYALSQGFVVK